MRRPTEATIGPFTYAIEWPAEVTTEDGDLALGEAEHVALVIRVARSVHPDLQRKTLLHEIMHACVFVTGHNDDAVTEEHFVRATSFALLQVLRDNPPVARFLMGRGR